MTAAAENDHLPVLEPGELAAAGRRLPPAFVLHLGDVRLVCRENLRLLPGRRLVARVEVDGRPAAMKLFLGRDAARRVTRERRGCAWLSSAGVATPAVLNELRVEGPVRACALLFEYLDDASPVAACDDVGVAAAAAQLARLHGAGLCYRDLHLDNFLQSRDGRVYVIDGDGVRAAGPLQGHRGEAGRGLKERHSLHELAVLCAQRPPLMDQRLPDVYRGYADARGWRRDDAARLALLAAATRGQRRARVRRFLKKAQRDCTEFHQHRTGRRWVVAVREAWDEDLAAFAADPEAAFRAARILKDGNSATVVRARVGGEFRVIKRYNIKGPWHAVRRALKPLPRYRLAWLNGQRLTLLGIPTARPLALVERRLGPLRGVAYLVMEDLGDLDLAAEIAAAGLTERRLAEIAALFCALSMAGLSHGDTKVSNFLVTPAGVALVDLDAMAEKSRCHTDVRRFLANFDRTPEVRERFRAALGG